MEMKTLRYAPLVVMLYATLPFSSNDISAGPRQDTPTLRELLQTELDQMHEQADFPGATAGFALADGEIFGLATGYSDLSNRDAMTPSDRLHMASLGKTFVAAIVLQLVGEGKIGLEDPVSKWLGDRDWFERLPNAKDLTIRMLLNHTSGLIHYERNPQFNQDLSRNLYKSWKPEELAAYLLDREPPFEAGKGWVYSDTNFILLGMIIEKICQDSYYSQLRQRLLEPLRLRDIVPIEGPVVPGLAPGYMEARGGGFSPTLVNGTFVFNPQFEWTGGGLAGTAEEIARWAKALYEGKVLGDPLSRSLLDGVEADPDDLGPGSRYGLAVVILPTPLGISYGHHGIFPGYRTRLMYFPEHKLAVVLQVNTSSRRALGEKGLVDLVVELARTITRHQSAD